jgi:hypothetical protein
MALDAVYYSKNTGGCSCLLADYSEENSIDVMASGHSPV